MTDRDDFWTESDYFTGPPLTDEMVRRASDLLGYKLPDSYLRLLRSRNGGTPVRNCFPTAAPTSWAKDHIAVSGIRGIGGEWGIDSPNLGTIPMVREWEYPDIGIVVGECPSAGHDLIMLDYSGCGRNGEPRVVHVETETPSPQITFLANDFHGFMSGLVHGSRYDAEA